MYTHMNITLRRQRYESLLDMCEFGMKKSYKINNYKTILHVCFLENNKLQKVLGLVQKRLSISRNSLFFSDYWYHSSFFFKKWYYSNKYYTEFTYYLYSSLHFLFLRQQGNKIGLTSFSEASPLIYPSSKHLPNSNNFLILAWF